MLFSISSNFNNNYFNLSYYNFNRIFKNKEHRSRYKEKFGSSSKKEIKEI
jgi:hypothetical protein